MKRPCDSCSWYVRSQNRCRLYAAPDGSIYGFAACPLKPEPAPTGTMPGAPDAGKERTP